MRFQTLGNPVLEPDEQFYQMVGVQMKSGAMPFVDIFDRKPYGLFLFYYLIASVFGTSALGYQLVVCAIVAATVVLIFHAVVLQGIDRASAIAAGCAYIVWLGLMQGEGGQAEVIYAPLVLGSALATQRAAQRSRDVDPAGFKAFGLLAMLLIGIAIQIKYTVIIEGVFFGLWLTVAAFRQTAGRAAKLAQVAAFAATALAPTVVCAAGYLAAGHGHEFVFANFQSIFGRNAETAENQIDGIIETGLILAALTIAAGLAVLRPASCPRMFWIGWLVAAASSYILMRLYVTPHYAIPILLPLVIVAAPVMGERKALVLLTVAAVISQFVLASNIARKGTAKTLNSLAGVAGHRGSSCIYVHDGYSALYTATASCLPTRWPFPPHLAFQIENAPSGLGVDPTTEIRRILASRPAVIYDRYPADAGANLETRKILDEALAAHYALAAAEELPGGVKLRAFTRR
ncbi:MAG: hypothetical protein V4579_11060 [Pseudomonadota bacterium]